ncbi:2-dehydro-3-deoxygalactonokinase [Martelella mangrovi]|uniref:2-dehydro-3-deoxygalactonokinase n=1 Tax=Martelella mangrovi TaxID=1397477 RepID=A0ABV2ID23_9HYPH
MNSSRDVSDRTALVALDWGTSSLRAFRMDAEGTVLERRSGGHGIQNLPAPGNAGFQQAFDEICGDWLEDRDVPVIAGGMVGSAQGWKEAPYLACPVRLETLGSAATAMKTETGRTILIAPGVSFETPAGMPDVMRGEEIQIAGVLADRPEWSRHSLLVLPGTHSKWAEVRNGEIVRFSTYMTGELYSVLVRHSILGRLMPQDGKAAPEIATKAFADGVAMARTGSADDLTHQLFAVRTLGLTGRLPTAALGDYLSGLLIGHELVSGLAQISAARAGVPLVLVGENALCERYARAFSDLGSEPAGRIENPAPRGLFWLAVAAGLVQLERSGQYV